MILEDCEPLHQVYLTESKSSQILANTPQVSQDLRYTPSSKQPSRQNVMCNLLLNDTRNGIPTCCQSCQKEKTEGFVVETTFYFCPSAQCVKQIPPNKITVHKSVTCAEIEILKTSDALFGQLLSV